MEELLTIPDMPKRTALHGLAPMGVGTPYCESLYSWFLRLADSHCVLPNDLMNYLGEKFVQEDRGRRGWLRQLHDTCFSGAEISTAVWVEKLTELSGRGDLAYLTMLPWRQVFALRGRGEPKRKWCPRCLEESEASGVIHTHLLWDIGLVDACPKHGVHLLHICPHCGNGGKAKNRRSRVAYHVPGHCAQCGGWLGVAETDYCEKASNSELERARIVGNWIADSPKVKPEADMSVVQVLKTAIGKQFGGCSIGLARWLGVPKSTLHGWVHGTARPTAENAINIAGRIGVSLHDLYQGKTESVPSRAVACPAGKPKRSRIRIKWDGVEEKLTLALETFPPPSAAKVAEDLRIPKRSLYLKFNALMKAIAARHEKHLRQGWALKAEARRLTFERLIGRQNGLGAREIRLEMEQLGLGANWSSYKMLFETVTVT